MLIRSSTLLVALLGLASLTAQAQQLNTAKLDSLLTGLAATNKMMGSLALSRDGQLVYSRAFGSQQLEPKTPATTATRYRVGSVSKVFTATMIMQLIDEKKLALTTPLAGFFPQLPNAQRITIDQLLSHRSGLHNFTNDAAYQGYMSQPQTQAQMLTIMSQLKSDFEPGAKAEYSNTNYVLLGYIVEKLTRQPYAQTLQKRIVAKAGLKNTFVGGKINPKKQEALSYDAGTPGWKPATETDMSIPGGAGAIVSTPTDLVRFQEALHGGRLVSAQSLEVMKTMPDNIGRGLFKLPFYGHVGYGHGGAIDGFRSNVGYFPADKLAMALTVNAQNYSLNDALLGVLSIYFNQPYKIPNFSAASFQPAPADLDRYAGTYASTQIPLKITMTKAGTTLQTQATGQQAFVLEPVSAGVFKLDQVGARFEFAAGKPAFTLQQGGGSFLFMKE